MLVLRTRLSVSSFNSRTLGRVRLQRCRNLDLLVCFNSRTLGRVRRNAGKMSHKLNQFQFTHPGKGATHEDEDVNPHQWFQFTHPGKGATERVDTSLTLPRRFNSRTLGRVRPGRRLPSDALPKVSIHAPWEGCDSIYRSTASTSLCFNSRTLGRVRLEGVSPARVEAIKFQFTHPGKGATVWCKVAYYGADKQA